jgi:hypothetical protein
MTPQVHPPFAARRRSTPSPTALSAVFLLIAAAALPACATSGVTRGADLYAHGHLIEAAEVFEHTEARLGECDAEERARYGLYRGAALLGLGDVERANRWLAYSEQHARALDSAERRMLSRARALATAATPLATQKLAGEPSLLAGSPPPAGRAE